MTPEQIGRLFALVGLPLLGIGLAIYMKVRGRRRWWIPLAIGVLLFVVPALGTLADLPREIDPRSALTRVPGYRFVPLTQDVRARFDATWRRIPSVQENVIELVPRHVETAEGRRIGVLVVMAVEPTAIAGDPGFDAGLARGLARSSGGKVSSDEIEGRQVTTLRGASGDLAQLSLLAWREENLVFVLGVRDERAARAIAGSLIEAQRSQAPE